MMLARATIAELDWRALALPIALAEDALARLDERLAKSPIRDGWIARTLFSDAAAALWLEGELVHMKDLVLHDAGMDVRTPTHELTRAHAILRTRRRIADAAPDWALSPAVAQHLNQQVANKVLFCEPVAKLFGTPLITPLKSRQCI